MVDKKEEKKNEDNYGLVGFTLGIAGIIALVGLLLPLTFALLYLSIALLVCFIIGLVLCKKQQNRKKTSRGRKGLIINLIGLIVLVALLGFSVWYTIQHLPELLAAAQSSQNFPLA